MINLPGFAPASNNSSGVTPKYINLPGFSTPASSPSAPATPKVSVPSTNAGSTPGIPNTALTGNLGGGYGSSNITDPYSGKPELTFENTQAKSSQLLSDRVAPTFDPTVPQKIDPSVLHNGRMPVSASEAVRKATGAGPDQQLDHLISLELGGSNETANLNNENLQSNGTQPSLTLENQTAKDVASGKISYIQGQINIARAKGVDLPDDTGFSSAAHPLAQNYNTPAPNQVGTKSQASKVNASQIATTFFPSTLQTLSELQLDPLSLKADPSKALADRTKAIGNSIIAEKQNIYNFFSALDTNQSTATKVEMGVTAGAGAINMVISPVTSLFAAANDIPVLGSLSRLVGAAFNVVGEGGTAESKVIAANTINKIPGLSDDSKAKITSAFGQIYSLAAQFNAGAAAEDIIPQAKEMLTEKFGATDAQTIVDKAQEVAKGNAIVPKTTLSDVADKNEEQAKTTDIKTDANPTVDLKPKVQENANSTKVTDIKKPVSDEILKPKVTQGEITPKTNKPTVDLSTARQGKPVQDINFEGKVGKGDMLSSVGSKLTEPIGKPVADIVPKETPVQVEGQSGEYKVSADEGGDNLKVVDKGTGEEEVVPRKKVTLKPKQHTVSDEIVKTKTRDIPVNEDGTKTSKIAKDIEAKAIEKGLTAKFKDLASFDPKTVKDQAERIGALMKEDMSRARNIVRGNEPLPEGMSGTYFLKAMEDRAMATGDGKLLQDLASSPLTKETSIHAQELRMAAERDPDSPLKRAEEIQKAREKAAEVKTGKKIDDAKSDIVKEEGKKMNEAIKKARTTARVPWDEFVKSITC